jgi:hypothetical protein
MPQKTFMTPKAQRKNSGSFDIILKMTSMLDNDL